ncbi:MAG: bifunctional DNA-binding transcriptional regulator/O6-methylguanine-DNA methyltransferase Ada [Verrucomicrobiota bacterium JB024]|nr:bifunctional DNA-binding transcriptional regulator/O6-methylguanine-DNA methyltransferase Ada [Verrucomicrobiota bacterium JB024]
MKSAQKVPATRSGPIAGTPGPATDEARWAAVMGREASADDGFVYAVKTTGIYCRPSCPSRRAVRANVVFFDTSAEAERAGFRACKRCRPDGPGRAERDAQAVERACELIASAEEMPDLATLAAEAGLSASHFHRLFKAAMGLTPKGYARARRAKRMREELPGSTTVTEAMYGAGYQSSGRFYAESGEVLGMRPSRFKKGGVGETIRFAVGECSLGDILVAASDKGVCAIFLGDEPDMLVRALQDRFPRAELVGGDEAFERTVAQVVGLVEGPRAGLSLSLDIRGTAFQQRVWEALREIPVGTTASYAEVAGRIGRPEAVRAVAQACGANALAVAIPCHRVVRTDGSLSGYRWGVERKRRLLDREKTA